MAAGATLSLLAALVALVPPQVERKSREAEPPPAPIQGRLLGEHDEPLAGRTIHALDSAVNADKVAARGSRAYPSALTDVDGGFRFEPGPGPSFLLVARAPDASTSFVFEDFTLDGSEILLRTELAGGFPREYVEGRILGVDGKTPLGTHVSLSSFWGWSATYLAQPVAETRIEVTGRSFRLGPLRPGRYVLAVEGAWPLRLPLVVEEGVLADVGELHLQPPGRIRVRFVGEVPPDAVVGSTFWMDGARSGGVRRAADGSGLSGPRAPGEYLVRTQGRAWRAPDARVQVVAGEIADVELVLQPATVRTFVARVPTEDPATRLAFRVTSDDGTFLWEYENTYRGKNCFAVDVEGLVPGDYRLEARSPRAATGVLVHEFAVHDLHPETGHVEIAF
jgi:hypothetical protein